MKPIKFKEQNFEYKKPDSMTDEQCKPLPVYKYDAGVISCWKMSLLERIKALFTGRVWLDVYGGGQPPVWLGINTPFIKTPKE
jgi:hypothetical protein